jgi:hypothetical protein
LLKKEAVETSGVAQVVECLLRKHETLSLNPGFKKSKNNGKMNNYKKIQCYGAEDDSFLPSFLPFGGTGI